MAPGSRPGSPARSPQSPGKAAQAVALELQMLLDDLHVQVMHSSLGRRWPRTMIIEVFLETLELNGVELSDTEHATLVNTPEADMLGMVVERMPDRLREDIESFCASLQLTASRATRIRAALEKKQISLVADMLDGADDNGVEQQILKRGLVMASRELRDLHLRQESWIANTEQRMLRLQEAASQSEEVGQNILQVEALLKQCRQDALSKSRHMLVGLTGSNTGMMLQSTFTGWAALTISSCSERRLRKQLEQELADTEAAILDCKTRNLSSVRAAMSSKAAEIDGACVRLCFLSWSGDLVQQKKLAGSTGAVVSLETKLETAKAAQTSNVQTVLARMVADSGSMMLSMCFQGFIRAVELGRLERQEAEQAKKLEAKVKEQMAARKQTASSVFARLTAATEQGLLSSVFEAWTQLAREEAQGTRLENLQKGGNLLQLKQRHLGHARSLQVRLSDQVDMIWLCRILAAWRQEARLCAVVEHLNRKIGSKRRQLNSISALFTNFAKQLEQGLIIDDDDSARASRRPSKHQDHMGLKDGKSRHGGLKSSVSLPAIHSAPQHRALVR